MSWDANFSRHGQLYYAIGGSLAIDIKEVNSPHAVSGGFDTHMKATGVIKGVSYQLQSGLTYNVGTPKGDATVATEANNGGLLRVTTASAHGLVTGDLICLNGMNNAGHDLPTKVTKINDTTFDTAISYVAGAGASTGAITIPAYLQVGASGQGVYYCSYNFTAQAAAANKTFLGSIYVETEAVPNLNSLRLSTGTLAAIITAGPIVLDVGDRVWFSIMNQTDASDITMYGFQLNLVKLSDAKFNIA